MENISKLRRGATILQGVGEHTYEYRASSIKNSLFQRRGRRRSRKRQGERIPIRQDIYLHAITTSDHSAQLRIFSNRPNGNITAISSRPISVFLATEPDKLRFVLNTKDPFLDLETISFQRQVSSRKQGEFLVNNVFPLINVTNCDIITSRDRNCETFKIIQNVIFKKKKKIVPRTKENLSKNLPRDRAIIHPSSQTR